MQIATSIDSNHSLNPLLSYSKSSAQILLRWSLQQGCSVIPKSLDPVHIRQNSQLDFTLTDEDIEKINVLFH